MKVAVGSDHAGFKMKEKVKRLLQKRRVEVVDFGTNSEESVDYPDYGLKVARAVAGGEVDYGITVCWTGNGMNMTANKIRGVRAGLALNPDMAFLTRSHNNANVLTLASKYTPENQLEEIIKNFLETPFEGGRHQRRVDKITDAEIHD
ncbi:MAG: ribose 5-phosphate isomerase B [candidate division Zixibacteria bacterium]|nr:ribose 5-phosphate isomerase B [candidate division Zixibacteria bacterium]